MESTSDPLPGTPSGSGSPTGVVADPTPTAHRYLGQGPTVKTRQLGNVRGFDGLRGIAVLIVYVSHTEVILPIPRILVVPGAEVPLDAFFVLSGFLITTLLLREQAKTGHILIGAFYKRRALRLLPALFFMLCGQYVFSALTGISFHEEWTSLLSVGLYYSNWKLALNSNAFGGNIASGLQHVWSLSFEEQFYLIWPWATIFVLTIWRSFRTVVIILIGLIVAVWVHRALSYHGVQTWYALFVRTDTRADSILFGALASHLWIRGREFRRYLPTAAWIATIFLLACLPLASVSGPFLYDGGFDAIDVACAILILAIADGDWIGRAFFQFKPLVVLGTVSYAFYLWHLPVFFAVRYYGGGWNYVVRVVVATAATSLFTALSWFLLERPALRMKERMAVVGARTVSLGGATSLNLDVQSAASAPSADGTTADHPDGSVGDPGGGADVRSNRG
jgi:peptidoglycan/LPS O-acetylase OafA/YrhL